MASLKMNRPLPGPELANVEYSRCNQVTTPTLGNEQLLVKPKLSDPLGSFE